MESLDIAAGGAHLIQPLPAPSWAVHGVSGEPCLDLESPLEGLQTWQSDHKCVCTRCLLHRQFPCSVWRPRLVCKCSSPGCLWRQGRPGGPAGRILAKIAPSVRCVGDNCVWQIAVPFFASISPAQRAGWRSRQCAERQRCVPPAATPSRCQTMQRQKFILS